MAWQEHLKKGSLALAREDYPFAQTELKLALDDAQTSIDDPTGLGIIYGLLAQSFFKHANFEEAEPLLKKAIALESQYLTNSSMPAKTRDLICLSEILRSKGSTFEALACLENALASFSSKPLHDETYSGDQEFDALKSLFASASAQAQKADNKPSHKKRHPVKSATPQLLPLSQFVFQPQQVDFQTASRSEESLEKEYFILISAVKIAMRADDQTHRGVIAALIPLIRVSFELDLTEQSEKFLNYAFSLAFGKNHARQLAIPNAASHIDLSLLVELMLTKADFYSHLQDFAAAAKCLADLMKWIEKQQELAHVVNEDSSGPIVGRFISLMQKADLYSSARILIKQAIEYEEDNELQHALTIYDKALLIFEQLFPANHLEIAQILQLKAAVLSACERHNEADDCQRRASEIEDNVAAVDAESVMRLARLPDLSLS